MPIDNTTHPPLDQAFWAAWEHKNKVRHRLLREARRKRLATWLVISGFVIAAALWRLAQ